MTDLEMNRTLTALEQREADLEALEMPAERKRKGMPLGVRMAAHKAAEKAALRRQYIERGMRRMAA